MFWSQGIYVGMAVLFSGFIAHTIAIRCYRCVVTPTYNNEFNNTRIPLCSRFEETDEFIVECLYSTMCQKKVLRMELQKDVVETVTRGCADQKFTNQVFRDGRWRPDVKIEEPYEEGCRDFKENTLSSSSTTYCHCRGNFCNSATKDNGGYHTDTMAVILVFNAMRYLRSSRTE